MNEKNEDNKIIAFVKKHKKNLGFTFGTICVVLVGAGISKVIAVEHRKYSTKWFENASDELLDTEREIVRKQYCSSGDDFSLAVQLENLLRCFDAIMSKRAWDGKVPGFPVHGENGWYLLSDD